MKNKRVGFKRENTRSRTVYVRDNPDITFLFQLINRFIQDNREGVDSFAEFIYRASIEYLIRRVTQARLYFGGKEDERKERD